MQERLYGGTEVKSFIDIMKKSNPEILVATPGRLKQMIVDTQLFKFDALQWVIFDECDRLLNGDFETDLQPLRAVLPPGANRCDATQTSHMYSTLN